MLTRETSEGHGFDLALAAAFVVATAAGLAGAAWARGWKDAHVDDLAGPHFISDEPGDDLADTGLFAVRGGILDREVLGEGVLPFAPQYPLWTDGARKRRWIRLPAGTEIDGADPDAWVFPIGTELWKEFAFDGRPVETRHMRRRSDGAWSFTTYAWNAEGTAARRSVGTGGDGVAIAVALADGVTHGLPGTAECTACHDGATPVLGFSALQLSVDRDPLAPHAEPAPEGAIDLRGLLERGLLTGWPASLGDAPRIAADTPEERAALGYLHGNCGGCHDDDGALASLGMTLAWDPEAPSAVRGSLVATRARAPLPGARPGTAASRVEPGRPDRSVLLGRMRSRHPVHQMPPIGTRLVDDDAVALLETWIRRLEPTTATANPNPNPNLEITP
ncbi:MAG: hypothetical protein JNK45_35480 [Myxococcales bacterium]|nr:hypothetical protein [Myxococcales bacterium]